MIGVTIGRRPVLLVGSLNLANRDEVFAQVATRLRDDIRSVPDGETGERGTWVSWGAMGYTCYWTRGVFGIVYNPDGIQFVPCVPHSFGRNFYAVLNNFAYRDSNLRIILKGCGTVVQSILVDGVATDSVPATLAGSHVVEITMSNAGTPAVPSPPR